MAKAYDVVKDFEKTIAKWAGSKYGVAVDSCTNAIFLCLKYWNVASMTLIKLPKRTYPGVAMSVVHSGYLFEFEDIKWKGIYWILPTNIIDSALRFKKNMYIPNTYYCLSFHYKKHLPIGRGGMILTNDKKAVNWLRKARWDGRNPNLPLNKDNAAFCGWNMYMTPNQAARGLALFEAIKHKNLPDLKVEEQHYPDLSKWRCFRE